MKSLLIILFLSISIQLLAPGGKKYITLEAGKAISQLENLIRAVVWVESQGNVFAYNPREGAVGAFQIRQIRVSHYNRLKGTNYRLKDFYDYDLSKEMFVYFAQGKTMERAAKDWNGSGAMTEIYWNKVKAIL